MARLTDGFITLRPWRDSDASELALIADCKEISDNLRDGFPNPYHLKDAENWLALTRKFRQNPTLYFAVDIERIYAEPYAYNSASQRVLQKNGFTCEAVLKKYVIKNNVLLDSCIYSLLRDNK